jgi:hypothetical protein
LKKVSRLSFPLLTTVVLGVIALTSGQESAPASRASVFNAGETTVLLQKYKEISALPVADRRNFFRSASAADKSSLWKIHLALYLVEHPALNEGQKKIILDAISISSPKAFETADNSAPLAAKSDHPFKPLMQSALTAFPRNQAAEVFASLGGNEAQDELLQKYHDISAQPMRKRKASFRNAAASDKADLWKTHLALYLARRADLNEAQKDTILTAMSFATAETFQIPSSDARWKTQVEQPLRSLESRIVALFSKDEGVRVFATLGEPEVSVGKLEPGTATLLNVSYLNAPDSSPYSRILNRTVEQEEIFSGDCVCSTESDWCWNWCGGAGCKRSDSGCGTMWAYSCNGASCH